MAILSSLALIVFSFSSVMSLSPETVSFSDWMAEHEVSYETIAERVYRESVFRKNAHYVAKLNDGLLGDKDGAEYALNRFADLTPSEFKLNYLMNDPIPRDIQTRAKPYRVRTLKNGKGENGNTNDAAADAVIDTPPASFDWREHPNAVGPVHDQGSAGSCWAFSAVETLASAWGLAHGNLTSLSVEQVVECDALKDPPHAACGVFGGWPYLAYEFIKNTGGIMSEADAPYCAGGGTKNPPVKACFPCVPKGWNNTLCGNPPEYCDKNETMTCPGDPSKFVTTVDSYHDVPNDIEETKGALVKNGPLSVCLNAAMLQFYHKGVWNPHLACNKGINELDHCVQMVGYGHLDGKDAYIVRNSWGTKWGMDGFFYIAQGNTCGIQQLTTWVVAKSVPGQ